MAKTTLRLHDAERICERCGKRPVTGYNRPNSLHRTKRIFLPNIIKHAGKTLCSRCLRTLRHLGDVKPLGRVSL
ncbi:MAG: L28 family ribosomal protein [Patescibacteria group bacterium]